MGKIKLGTNVFVYPMPVTLLGTKIGGKANFMTLGWITRANANPPILAIGVGKHHYTRRGIMESGEFSVSYPDREMLEITDFCGIYSGEKEDKSGLFETFNGELSSAPMIARCPLAMECRVLQHIDLPTNTLFIGEIVGCYCEEDRLAGGKPDFKKLDSLMLTMPDNSYWSAGERIGSAWQDGKNYGPARK